MDLKKKKKMEQALRCYPARVRRNLGQIGGQLKAKLPYSVAAR
jgi:hypothetical protein